MAKVILKEKALKDDTVYFVQKSFNADVKSGEVVVIGGKCHIATQDYKSGSTTDATFYTGGVWQIDTTDITGAVKVLSALYIDSSGDFTMTKGSNVCVGAITETNAEATYVFFY